MYALSTLHSKGFVHGDLKLDNIMVDDLGTLKISDFGFLKRSLISTSKYSKFDEVINDKLAKYNLNYKNIGVPMINSELNTPPEIFKKDDYELEPSYDIWCLGMVVYEMLTGEHMFVELEKDTEA